MWKTASVLISCVVVLVSLGILMLWSTSSSIAAENYGDSQYYVKRQLLWLLIAICTGLVMGRFDYHHLKPLAVPLAVVAVILLAMAVMPGLGITVKGSSRWLKFGPIRFQPSEIAKITMIISLAWWMSRKQRQADRMVPGILIPLFILLGIPLILILIEPDYGTTFLVAAVGFAIMFVGGSRISYLAIAAVLGSGGLALLIAQNEERMRRIIAFLNPDKYAQNEAFQLLNALYAFVIGGGTGVGLGQSLQKRRYLPEAHTDFIFAIIGEELGIFASAGVVAIFMVIFICGMIIAYKSVDVFGRLLAFGITTMLTLQAMINIGVVTGCLPTKGLALPFISAGGSSLIVSSAMIGILINIAWQASGDWDKKSAKDTLDNMQPF